MTNIAFLILARSVVGGSGGRGGGAELQLERKVPMRRDETSADLRGQDMEQFWFGVLNYTIGSDEHKSKPVNNWVLEK